MITSIRSSDPPLRHGPLTWKRNVFSTILWDSLVFDGYCLFVFAFLVLRFIHSSWWLFLTDGHGASILKKDVNWERDIKILRFFLNNVCHYHLSLEFALETRVYLLLLDVSLYRNSTNKSKILLQIKTDSVILSLLSLRLIISKFRSWGTKSVLAARGKNCAE